MMKKIISLLLLVSLLSLAACNQNNALSLKQVEADSEENPATTSSNQSAVSPETASRQSAPVQSNSDDFSMKPSRKKFETLEEFQSYIFKGDYSYIVEPEKNARILLEDKYFYVPVVSSSWGKLSGVELNGLGFTEFVYENGSFGTYLGADEGYAYADTCTLGKDGKLIPSEKYDVKIITNKDGKEVAIDQEVYCGVWYLDNGMVAWAHSRKDITKLCLEIELEKVYLKIG